MKASKRLISIIFTLMMLFVGIAAIHAEEIITENIKLLETIEINNGDVGSDELVPMSANECIYYPSKFIGTPGSSTEEYTSKGEKYVIKFGSVPHKILCKHTTNQTSACPPGIAVLSPSISRSPGSQSRYARSCVNDGAGFREP